MPTKSGKTPEPEARRTRSRLPRLTDRLRLGSTGLSVSPVCLGIVEHPDVVLEAFRAGVNFFFLTADMHWPSYEAARRGLSELFRTQPRARKKVVVAAASYVTQPEFCQAPFEEVVEAVPGLGRVDLAVIGGSYATDFLTRLDEYRRRPPGGARALGASFHERSTLVTAVNHELVDVAFLRYNSGHRGAERDVFPALKASRKVKLFNFQSTHGHLSNQRLAELNVPSKNWHPEPPDHYRFVLGQPRIDGILCALAEPGHVHDLRRALARGALSPAEDAYVRQLAELDAGRIRLRETRKKAGRSKS